jgi:propionyl-CoA carboxylase alpha chain
VPLFVVDPRLVAASGTPRLAYLRAALDGLAAALGGALVQRVGDPVDIVPGLARELDVDTVFVSRGLYRFSIPPRFPLPDEAGRAGSLVAPMPGSVLRLLVAVGDTVAAGQPLLAMEAMKMEHQVVAPAAGTVAEIFVQVGQQLAHGQRLVQLETAGSDE